MSIVDKKKKIFGNIGAAKTLIDGLPKLKLNSSFPSINNGGDSVKFLTDLITSLIGYEELIKKLETMLTFSLQNIEKDIKKILKDVLKEVLSCGINPSIPTFIRTNGIVIELDKIDFLEILKIDPKSQYGDLLYTDVTSILTDSSDFNTFLFGVIQSDSQTFTWKNIFDITFYSQNDPTRVINPTTVNNSLVIKTTANYSNNKKIVDLNNDFINSLILFNSTVLINRMIDIIFGSISVSISKTRKQLELEAKINNVIDNLSNANIDNEMSDDFFSFTNDEINKHQEEADFRKKGILKLISTTNINASVPISFLTDFTKEMKDVGTNLNQQKNVISSNLSKMAQQNTINSLNLSDHVTIKINFVQQIIQNLIKSITTTVLSPKVIIIFLINYKIIYGNAAFFSGPVDFMKKNKRLFSQVVKGITEAIIKFLIQIALKRISELVAAKQVLKLIERGKNQQAQLLSLVGIPQEVLRKIKGLL